MDDFGKECLQDARDCIGIPETLAWHYLVPFTIVVDSFRSESKVEEGDGLWKIFAIKILDAGVTGPTCYSFHNIQCVKIVRKCKWRVRRSWGDGVVGDTLKTEVAFLWVSFLRLWNNYFSNQVLMPWSPLLFVVGISTRYLGPNLGSRDVYLLTRLCAQSPTDMR